jgi:acyl-CoA dehydrogenase
MNEELPGREDLVRWTESRPTNYYEESANLRDVLDVRAGIARRREMEPRLHRFGGVVALTIDPAVTILEHRRELPAHVPYDAVGRRVDRIEFHPDYERASAAVWDSGLLACDDGAGGAFEQAALFYLLSHVGEGGVACPAVCTAGLGRAVAGRGSPALRERYLGGLRSARYAGSLRGSQFLTEVQGGSDVGANLVGARRDAEIEGAWRITGEKWFCSVADADLFAVTARPESAVEGTRGLGCFLVPRTLDGATPNGFRIRQLKDKLGTRCLASAEIDFDGALGWPIGGIDEGFHVAVEELLNTSRWLNAVGSTGLMRRSYLEAVSFARHRRAFGRTIATIPIVREQLALMKAEEYAALSSTLALTGLVDRIDRDDADPRERAVHRLLVNVNKYRTSLSATDVVHQGIEILGGNGTIENFSALPRLYRDAVVYESWEGTHNVLCAQVQRDCTRLNLLDDVVAWIGDELSTVTDVETGPVESALAEVTTQLRETIGAGEVAGGRLRRQLDRLARVIQATTLLHETSSGGDEKRAVASLFASARLGADLDPSFATSLVDRVLGEDLS